MFDRLEQRYDAFLFSISANSQRAEKLKSLWFIFDIVLCDNINILASCDSDLLCHIFFSDAVVCLSELHPWVLQFLLSKWLFLCIQNS